jgi:hypothetical protein
VFISHARGDRNIARQLALRLRERGFSTWVEDEDIEPGMDWGRVLRDAIESSRLCVVLVSDKASPPPRFLSAEWAAIQDSAWRRPDLTVCPVVLDDVDIPVFLRSSQGIRLSRKGGNIEKAVDDIVRILGQRPADRTAAASERESSERAARFSEMINTLTEVQKTASNK